MANKLRSIICSCWSPTDPPNGGSSPFVRNPVSPHAAPSDGGEFSSEHNRVPPGPASADDGGRVPPRPASADDGGLYSEDPRVSLRPASAEGGNLSSANNEHGGVSDPLVEVRFDLLDDDEGGSYDCTKLGSSRPVRGNPHPTEDSFSSDIEKISKHIVDAYSAGTVDVNLSDLMCDLMKHISLLLELIDKGETTAGHSRSWPGHSTLSRLLAGTVDALNPKSISQATKGVAGLVNLIEPTGLASKSLLVVAYGLQKFADVSDNKEKCLSILKEMNFLAKLVHQCEKRLMEGMNDEIIKSTELIVKGAVACCTQIKSSSISKYFKTSVNKGNLSKIEDELKSKYRNIYMLMQIEIYDAVHRREKPSGLSREYPNHAVGIEEPIKEVTDLLEWGSEKHAVAVILYGFGGMGKTTLADAVFNQVDIQKVDEEVCKYSHVELFKNIESIPDIIELQKKMLEDLTPRQNEDSMSIPEIRKYQDGQRELARILKKVPAFIYIDNVLETEKLRQLLPLNLDTAKKVRLLITARDINVRKACRMETPPKEYHMRGISSRHAMTLLEKENKKLNSSQLDFIIYKCGGIPWMLSAVVHELSFLKDKHEVDEVIGELEKLEGEEFGEKLESVFFVYEKLPKECKEPLLDICSFFRGWEWDVVGDIVGKGALDRLERRALVARGINGVVTVHDVILEVGRRKARRKRVRFTETTELLNFMEDAEKVEQLRYLKYKPAKDLNQLIKHNLKMPANLKFMEIDGKLHSDDMEIFPTRLLRLPELRILKLSNFQGLKELPSVLSDLVNDLRELTLSNCVSFKELPYSISKLKSLRVLRMVGCKSLQELPEDVGTLASLVEIDLSKCENLKRLPEKIGLLGSLQRLKLDHCKKLTMLPDRLEKLSSLEILNLSSCKALKNLPDDLGKLTSLINLDLSRCQELSSIPKSIGQLKRLRSIDMSWCSKITRLPDEFCDLPLTNLKLTRCSGLEKLPDQFGKLESLRVLKLKSCNKLQKLPESFCDLKCLEHLDLSGSEDKNSNRDSGLLELCKDFNGLLSLRTLSLSGCNKLKKLPENFHCLSSLQHLDVSSCTALEGDCMDSVVTSKTLEMVYIKESDQLKKRWENLQGDQLRPKFKVDIGQDLPQEEKEKEWEKLSPEFDRLFQNGQGEPFSLTKHPANTILLLLFDGHSNFKQDFPWPLIEDTIDDIQINFEIVYIGKHFNKLPKIVADKITGRALDNSDARLLLEKLFFTLKKNGVNSWHQKMNNHCSMSTKIVVKENGDKYLSCWERLSDYQMEEFVLRKCGRYLWLKQLATKTQESNIQLLRELFVNGGEGNCVVRKSQEVEVDELKGKTILLEIRPANASYDTRLQSLKDMYEYITEEEKFNLEIISIPLGQLSIKFEQFSGDIPWLVFQNSWTIPRAVQFFIVKWCQWKEWDGGISESWYPGRVMQIEPNGRVAPYEPVLSMLERWGPKVYPFTKEKINELRKKEWNKQKRMSSLEFLFKTMEGELKKVKKSKRDGKMICLICSGSEEFVTSVTTELKDVKERVHFINVPYSGRNRETMPITDSMSMEYFRLEDSKPPQEIEQLSEWDAMRFWMRVCNLQREIKEMDENDKHLKDLTEILNALKPGDPSMILVEKNGKMVKAHGDFIQ